MVLGENASEQRKSGVVGRVISHPEGDWQALKQRITGSGLLDKQPAWYAWSFLWIATALGASGAVLAWTDGLVVQLANGAFLAFVFIQIGFLMHDAGHRQVFRSAWKNDLLGLLCANLLLGLSYSWWTDKHNRHHADPNRLDLDPDTRFLLLAFNEEQARAKPKLCRLFVKYQGFLFVPLLFLESLNLYASAFKHLVRGKAKRPWLEGTLLVCHHGLYFSLVFGLLDTWSALGFIAINQALSGFYSGSVFAPNHKGMLTLEQGKQLTFVERQVLTSRNVRSSPVNDFLYGGLNYQIEHHLFPGMPRHKLPMSQRIIKEFCRECGLAYHETGIIQSYWEILRYLHQVGTPLR